MGTLDSKRAIITGGAGALGSAVVATLLAEGASVFVPVHQTGDIEKLRARLGLADDAPLSGAFLDLTDVTAVQQTYAGVAASQGGIDILVNAAGGFAGGKPVHETDWEVWQQQLDMNLKTVVASCHGAIPHMLGRGGAIINVSSRTATQAGGKLAAYASAKRAILQLTEALADELREHDITVNAVLPSTIDTPANRAAMPKANQAKWVKPEAIARVILFLAGPDARIISGAAVPVYGKA
jgi:NAD(P)-dependent dehydrogenase (short-subunit alcohol dehydrogenase family)